MRSYFLASLVFGSALIGSAQTVEKDTLNHPAPKLDLRLVAVKPAIQSGDRVQIRVELWNIGTEDVIVAQNLGSTFGNSSLNFILTGDHGGESAQSIGDSIPDTKTDPDFEKTFVKNWLTLNKGHFYGTYVNLDSIDYSLLRKPGTYQISAQYFSRGIYNRPVWNGSFLRQSDIDKLPIAAFQGSLSSNSVAIRVLSRKLGQ